MLLTNLSGDKLMEKQYYYLKEQADVLDVQSIYLKTS